MRFLVVLCVIAALAAPSFGESAPAPENPPESVQAEPQAAAAVPTVEQPAEQPAPPAAENPAPETENAEETNVPVPDNTKPLVDPTPAPGEKPAEVPTPHRPSLSNFFHSLYDRFSLPSFHWPSLWPFRRGYPLRDSYPPRGRYPPGYPPVYIVRENEPMNEDYY